MYRQYPFFNPYLPCSQQFISPFFPPFFPQPGQQTQIDSGSALKNRTGSLRITFSKPFSKIPTVVVSPFWKGQNTQVSYVETITDVSTRGFTVVSDNAANNYYVNWIAVL